MTQRFTIILIFLLPLCLTAVGQTPTLPQVTNYTPREYNGHAQTFGGVQDDKGVMYFANVAGILEFDGSNWKKYRTQLNGLALSIDIDDRGNIFVGGIGEFGKLGIDSTGQHYFHSLSAELPDSLREFNNVWNVVVLDDAVYFNCMKHIFVYKDGQLSNIEALKSIPRAFEVAGDLWYHDRGEGIYRLNGDERELLVSSEFFNDKSISAILPMDEFRYMVATRDSGLYFYTPDLASGQSIQSFDAPLNETLKNAKIYGGLRLRSGQLVFNTLQSGLFVLSSELHLIQQYAREEGLQNETVINVFEDNSGNLWCGTDNGISCIGLNSPFGYAKDGEVYNGAIQAITEYQDALYLATVQGIFRFQDNLNGNRGFDRVEGVMGQCFDFETIDQDLLIASYEVFHLDSSGVQSITPFQSRIVETIDHPAGIISAIAGGVEGVVLLEKSTNGWEEKLRISEFPDEVQELVQETNGVNGDSVRFWISTWTKGIHSLTVDAAYTGYRIQAFSDSTYGLPRGQITLFQLNGRNYFATLKGVYAYQESERRFTEAPVLFPKNKKFVYRFTEGKDGELWVSSGRRAFHFTPTDNGYKIDSTSFMAIDVGGINAIYYDDSNRFWMGGDDALVSYDHSEEEQKFKLFHSLIRKVTLGEDSLLFAGVYEQDGYPTYDQPDQWMPVLTYKNNSLTFEFSSTYFEYRDKLEFSHQLQGYDQDFSSWNNEAKAVYTNLPEGQYTFRVKARNVYKQESTEATYQFSILPPWYRTWWAYLLYVLSGLTLFVAAIKVNASRLRREKDRLEAVVKQRTLELDEKNKALEHTNAEILLQKALVEEKNRDITDSILYAEKIQRAILTSDEYLQNILPQHFVFYQPKSILSGDFYWAYGIKDERGQVKEVIYAAVDCTGHGVPGALMSMIGSALLNEIVIENGEHEVDEVLNQLRTQIISAFGQKGTIGENRDGMDMTICKWKKEAMQVEFAGAKNPLYIIRDGELTEYKGDNQPISFYPELRPFSKQVIDVKSGDMLFTFSDGFMDQFGGEKEKKYLSGNFKKLLVKISGASIDDQKRLLSEAFEQWRGTLEQVDDVCVIGVRV